MIFRLTRALRRWGLERAIAGVRETPPLRPAGAGPIVATLLRTTDVVPYLLAIKSLARHLPVAAVQVIDDGTLRPADHALLRAHIAGLEILPIAAIPTGRCPRGGCWERLLHITDLSEGAFVVQLDADILVTGPIPEVSAAVAANRSFTLGTGPQYDVVTTAEASATVRDEPPDSVQVAAEQALDAIPPELGTRYVRGSAGFAGFARGAAPRARAEALSAAMQARLGSRWSEWGTEQVASNFLIASAPDGMMLPWPRYCCYYGGPPDPASTLFHFIGTWRFDHGVYERLGRRVVEDLRRG